MERHERDRSRIVYRRRTYLPTSEFALERRPLDSRLEN